jgi:hypothetical protein
MAALTGTQVLSTAALQLPSAPCVQASIRNNDASIAILIGFTSTAQNYTIPAGGEVTIRVRNVNRLWAKSASGTPTLSYLTV